MRTWTLHLPPHIRPLTSNEREHWRPKAKRVAHVRAVTLLLAKQAGIPRLPRIRAQLHYAPPDRRRRDAQNLVPTLKPIEDGLVDARVVPDDTAEHLEPVMPRLEPVQPDKHAWPTGQLWVVVHEMPAHEPWPDDEDLIVGSNGHAEHPELWP